MSRRTDQQTIQTTQPRPMSVQDQSNDSSAADSTDDNYNARLKSYQRLGVEIGETVVAKGGGDTSNPRVVQTPLNNEIGRVNVTGRIVDTDVDEGRVGKLTVDVGNDYQIVTYAYSNSNSNPQPIEIKSKREGTPVSLTLRPDVYGQNNPDVNGVFATPRIESLNIIEEETMWANLAEAASNTLNRIQELKPKVEAHVDDPTSDAFDAEIGMWQANYSESDIRSIETHAEIILQDAKQAILGEEESEQAESSPSNESNEEQALRELLEQYDIYQPAIATLVATFDTPWEMFEHDNLGDLNNVGRKTVEDIETIQEDMGA